MSKSHGSRVSGRQPLGEAKSICICGKLWESHLTAKGKLRKGVDSSKHHIAGESGLGRGMRRRLGAARKSSRRMRPLPPSIATAIAVRNPRTGKLERFPLDAVKAMAAKEMQ